MSFSALKSHQFLSHFAVDNDFLLNNVSNNVVLKFIYSEKATKILRNLPLTSDYSTYGQKLGEDFAKSCGLLRIYELYKVKLGCGG